MKKICTRQIHVCIKCFSKKKVTNTVLHVWDNTEKSPKRQYAWNPGITLNSNCQEDIWSYIKIIYEGCWTLGPGRRHRKDKKHQMKIQKLWIDFLKGQSRKEVGQKLKEKRMRILSGREQLHFLLFTIPSNV